MLTELLTKLGLKREDLKVSAVDPVTGLNERETFEQWEEILKEEMTIAKILEFIDNELEKVQIDIANPDNTFEKEYFLKAEIRILTILKFYISSPQMAKDKLESYLTRLGIK